MGLRPSRVYTSILDPEERRRLLAIEPFRATSGDPKLDKHLIRLGLIRVIKGSGRVSLMPAGRVARRLVQELVACSVSKL